MQRKAGIIDTLFGIAKGEINQLRLKASPRRQITRLIYETLVPLKTEVLQKGNLADRIAFDCKGLCRVEC